MALPIVTFDLLAHAPLLFHWSDLHEEQLPLTMTYGERQFVHDCKPVQLTQFGAHSEIFSQLATMQAKPSALTPVQTASAVAKHDANWYCPLEQLVHAKSAKGHGSIK